MWPFHHGHLRWPDFVLGAQEVEKGYSEIRQKLDGPYWFSLRSETVSLLPYLLVKAVMNLLRFRERADRPHHSLVRQSKNLQPGSKTALGAFWADGNTLHFDLVVF